MEKRFDTDTNFNNIENYRNFFKYITSNNDLDLDMDLDADIGVDESAQIIKESPHGR